MKHIYYFVFVATVTMTALLIGCGDSSQNSPSAEQKSVQMNKPGAKKPQTAVDEVILRYQNHPDENCRKDMTEWLRGGKVRIIQNLAMPDDGLASTLQRGYPTILFHPHFFQQSFLPPQYYEAEKDSILFHEYIHIRDHISGKILMIDAATTKLSDVEIASRSWNAELSATSEEWKFLKKAHLELKFFADGMPSGKSEKRALLDMLFDSMQQTYPPQQVKNFLPTWRKLYAQELDNLKRSDLVSGLFFLFCVILKTCLNYPKYKPLLVS